MERHPYGEEMIQPESEPVHDKSHEHVDMDDLMDASSRGPSAGSGGSDRDVDTGRAAGGDGEEVDVSGESSDAYMSGQDGGSID